MKIGLTGLLIILILELVYAENIFSQIVTEEINLQTIYPGLIITLENDTVSGYIMLTNLMKNQKKAGYTYDYIESIIEEFNYWYLTDFK